MRPSTARIDFGEISDYQQPAMISEKSATITLPSASMSEHERSEFSPLLGLRHLALAKQPSDPKQPALISEKSATIALPSASMSEH